MRCVGFRGYVLLSNTDTQYTYAIIDPIAAQRSSNDAADSLDVLTQVT
jgi:hypothetical protein